VVCGFVVPIVSPSANVARGNKIKLRGWKPRRAWIRTIVVCGFVVPSASPSANVARGNEIKLRGWKPRRAWFEQLWFAIPEKTKGSFSAAFIKNKVS
jgi:hypothetical protein